VYIDIVKWQECCIHDIQAETYEALIDRSAS
jgi:hypothetical protein